MNIMWSTLIGEHAVLLHEAVNLLKWLKSENLNSFPMGNQLIGLRILGPTLISSTFMFLVISSAVFVPSRPLLISVPQLYSTPPATNPSFNLSNQFTDWEKYREIVKPSCTLGQKIATQEQLDESAEQFRNTLQEAVNAPTPQLLSAPSEATPHICSTLLLPCPSSVANHSFTKC